MEHARSSTGPGPARNPVWGKLNSFQRTMLGWNKLHPYNAVHVVRVSGSLDSKRLEEVVRGTLESLGLTGLRLVERKARFTYLGGAAQTAVRILSPESDMAQFMEAELNAAFASNGSVDPFRFFAKREGPDFLLGLTYFHAVCDAEAIALLLKRIVCAYEGRSIEAGEALDVCPASGDDYMLWHPRLLLGKLAAALESLRMLRTSRRTKSQSPHSPQNSLLLFSLPSGLLSELLAASKRWGVTLNDLFLALLLKGLARLAPQKRFEQRRRNLSVGCVVNTRRDLEVDSSRLFGLFLGFFAVSHPVPDDIKLRDLALEVNRQTVAIKRRKLYMGTPMDLALGRLMLSLYPDDKKRGFYRRHFPLWGGITNMNIRTLWGKAPGEEEPLDYFRAVSTGPVTPMAFSLTTVRKTANIGLSYQTSVFTMAQMEQLRQFILESAAQLG